MSIDRSQQPITEFHPLDIADNADGLVTTRDEAVEMFREFNVDWIRAIDAQAPHLASLSFERAEKVGITLLRLNTKP